MERKITLLDMAKLTEGKTLLPSGNPNDHAVLIDDIIFVKHLDAYYPILFERDLIHELSLLLLGNSINNDERTCLHYLAHKLNIEDQLYEKMFGKPS